MNVLVTGASMGVGRATAIAMAKKGALVWAVARSADLLSSLENEHGNITAIPADVSSESERERVIETIGHVDVLVNNAGTGKIGEVIATSRDEVRQIFETNVLALIDLTQLVLPGMLERKKGHVCNVGSGGGYISTADLTIYSASKFAVQGFTDGLRREVSNKGVTVSLITPGPIKTSFDWRAAGGDNQTRYSIEGSGVEPTHVASAILRAIHRDRIPGYQAIAVPRAMGIARLGDLPGMRLVADSGASMMRMFGWL